MNIYILKYLIFLLLLFSISSCYKKIIDNTQIDNVDITKVRDGTYSGFYNMKFTTAKVNVEVLKGKITKIDLLEHKHGKKYSAETIIPRIINEQKLSVDAVTGATGSSKAILKAVEIALKKGL